MRKIISRLLFLAIGGIFCATIIVQAAIMRTTPAVSQLPPLHNGDLVFQTFMDTQSLAIYYASDGNLYSHMGMIKIGADGVPLVVNAAGLVREAPLADWLQHGVGKRLAIRRMKDLKPQDAAKALAWAKKQYGKPYDFFFLPDEKAFYCSELVEDAFKEGAGISLGKYQRVDDLPKSSSMDDVIRERWQMYPLCQDDKSMTFDKCYKIIMQQTLITPASIAHDPRMEEVYSNYPFGE